MTQLGATLNRYDVLVFTEGEQLPQRSRVLGVRLPFRERGHFSDAGDSIRHRGQYCQWQRTVLSGAEDGLSDTDDSLSKADGSSQQQEISVCQTQDSKADAEDCL